MLIAIDPGCMESAYVIIDKDYKPVEFGKFCNENVRVEIRRQFNKYYPNVSVAIEMIASYGMAVGAEVFETCFWIGRYTELVGSHHVTKIYRKDVKLNLCESTKAKDSNVMQALIDRFALHDFKSGKGTKKNPDWFYGFYKDIWQAYAVGVTYLDKQKS